jgi:hypothetical protein
MTSILVLKGSSRNGMSILIPYARIPVLDEELIRKSFLPEREMM